MSATHPALPFSAPQLPRPRSVYVHVPFCRHRCGYCNFTLVAGRSDLEPAYLQALERELATTIADAPVPVDTLFFGGGTPTHLSPPYLRRLMELVRHFFRPVAGAEWSVEANPSDITSELVDVLAEFGVTRVSLGAQSFSATKLTLLERDHSAETIARAAELVRQRLSTLALDLIFAAPGETVADWQADLRQALALKPDHISTYGLTFERGTRFWSRRLRSELASANEDDECGMYLAGIDTLVANGFEHYEVSNFARPGRRCRHNEVYWTGGEYWAFGPGASRHVAGWRETNHRSTTTWIKRLLAGQSPVAEREQLGAEDRARERLVFGLRRLEGVQREEFAASTGFELEALGGLALSHFLDSGHLRWNNDRLQLTRAGLLVSDALWPEFLRC